MDTFLEKLNTKSTPPIETFVTEFTTNKKIGFDNQSSQEMEAFLQELAVASEISPVASPQAHLSPKYGFSGWLPGEVLHEPSVGAIHIYAWDDRDPSFVSVDIAGFQSHILKRFTDILLVIRKRFEPLEIVSKTSHEPLSEWKNIAPQICRQRLALMISPVLILNDTDLEQYFHDLCGVLKMDQLTPPLIHHHNDQRYVWEHWETSGVVAQVTERTMDMNIYTCKNFSVREALDFTRSRVGDILQHREF